ncbi:hypothetical protein HNO89_002868 [Sporosarcina luteola]|nr:hypothetical protein [Sporosarcina luteola]
MQIEREQYILTRELQHLADEYHAAPATLKSVILDDMDLLQDALTLLQDDSEASG